MFWIILSVLAAVGAILLSVARSKHNQRIRSAAVKQGYEGDKLESVIAKNAFAVPSTVNTVLYVAVFAFLGFGLFNKIFFYAEPGYIYHVRTILGQEKAVNDIGYNVYLFGRVNAWKKAITVQASNVTLKNESLSAEYESPETSANLTAQKLVFLDQVDAKVQATTRFRLPSDEDSFLRIAREYRSPENLLRTSLIPAFRETLQANASMMSAEEYFTGGRTAFNRDFEDQMENGIYIVRRIESAQETLQDANADATANAALLDQQQPFDDDNQIILIVQKQLDETGQPQRKPQAFLNWGIIVIEARITQVDPNVAFDKRMQQRQQASADRSIARERRIQEEEERLLAIARADREVAQRQGEARVVQIQKTTDAETDKQLTITEANKFKEQAEIDKERSQILLAKARIDAEAVQVAADAEAYQRRVVLEADNALAQKLDTEAKIQQYWADAFSKRAVPQTVFVAAGGAGSNGTTPTGSNVELQQMLQIMTMQMARSLDYDREVQNTGQK